MADDPRMHRDLVMSKLSTLGNPSQWKTIDEKKTEQFAKAIKADAKAKTVNFDLTGPISQLR